jgi:hypothetical protein
VRISIHADSATTKQTRMMLAALAKLGKHESATVGLNGPDCWTLTTPMLSPNEFAQVTGQLVKIGETPIAELLTS